METGDVKITKTGKNGIQQMTYTRPVADFNTFIKSPEKYIKGTSVKTTDKVASKPGDKDYKQLFAKLKMIGEKNQLVADLSAQVLTDSTKTAALDEALKDLNALILEYQNEQTAGTGENLGDEDLKKKIEAKVQEYVGTLAPEKIAQLTTELEAAIGDKSEQDIEMMLEPRAQAAQEIIDAAQNELSMAQSLMLEGFWQSRGEWVKKAVDTLLEAGEGLGTFAFLVSGVLMFVTDGNLAGVMKIIAAAGGITAAVSFILHLILVALKTHKGQQGAQPQQ